MHPHLPGDPDFETSVVDEFRERLLEYCTRQHTGGRSDARRLEVTITVVSARPVVSLRNTLRPYALRVLGAELPGARLGQVLFAVDEHLPAPWHKVSVRGRLRGDPVPPPEDRPAEPAHPVLVLTLAYERDHQYVFHLVASADWLPIRRGPAAEDFRYEIPLPDYLNAVPRGTLLDLRYWQGLVELRRTSARPDYAVQVDGHWLAPGQQLRIGPRGRIAYTLDRRESVLNYLLNEREW
ncbi:hypothetical protein ACFPIJ_61850 [Dactylosporangium cerinum]|uniref:Uncharacterized protein n=1 Tax=Dactylosporangium cerinum TaxID=1434730 RepID=A0ABV9WHM2_9ACTN